MSKNSGCQGPDTRRHQAPTMPDDPTIYLCARRSFGNIAIANTDASGNA